MTTTDLIDVRQTKRPHGPQQRRVWVLLLSPAIRSRDVHWCGPYDTKQDALEDKRGMLKTKRLA